MCVSQSKDSYLTNQKTTSGRTSFPPFSLGWGVGVGKEWESRLLRDGDSEMGARSLEEVSGVPGGGGNPAPPSE